MAGKSRTVGAGKKGKMIEMGTNVGTRVEDGVLYLAIKLDADNGRTPKGFRRIATTRGNVEVPGHNSIRLGLNCYDKA